MICELWAQSDVEVLQFRYCCAQPLDPLIRDLHTTICIKGRVTEVEIPDDVAVLGDTEQTIISHLPAPANIQFLQVSIICGQKFDENVISFCALLYIISDVLMQTIFSSLSEDSLMNAFSLILLHDSRSREDVRSLRVWILGMFLATSSISSLSTDGQYEILRMRRLVRFSAIKRMQCWEIWHH